MTEQGSIRPSAMWLVFFVIVVDLTGFGIVIPILPFISPALGGDEIDVALVIAVYSLCAGLAGPFWGHLSDRIGRKWVLMICLFGGALSYACLGSSNALWMVYAARAFGGLMAGSLPVASALMADLSTPERRAKAMGLVGTAFGIGLILGPLLGGLLAGDGESFAAAGWFACGLSMASVVLAALLLSNDTPGKGAATSSRKAALSMLGFVREKKAYWLVAQYVFHTSAVSAAIYLSPLWLAALLNWGPREVGLLFGAVGLAMIVIQGALMDWLTSRFGLLAVLGAGAAIFALSLLATSVVTGVWPRALAIFMAFAGATCCLPVLNVISSSVVAAQERGRMMGITAFAGSFGRVAGPLVSGAVLAVSGYKLAWLVVALPVLVVFWWSQTSARQYSRANQSSTEAATDTDPSVSVESHS